MTAKQNIAKEPILDTVLNAPETDTKTNEFVKSRKRTSFKEFTITKDLRPEIAAGFKVWLKGEMFHFDEEWDDLFDKYINRTL